MNGRFSVDQERHNVFDFPLHGSRRVDENCVCCTGKSAKFTQAFRRREGRSRGASVVA